MGAASSGPSAGSLAAPSSGTVRLHRALNLWNEAQIAKELASGGEPLCLCPIDALDHLEQFIVFAPDVERKSGSFAFTALGRFASNLLSHIVAQETGLGECLVTRESAPHILGLLLEKCPAAPTCAAVAAPLHSRSHSGAAWVEGPSSLLDALRLMVCAAKGSEQVRRARANFLLPTVLAVVAHLPQRVIPARDLVFWGDMLSLEFLAPIAEASNPPFSASLPSGDRQPLLIAAVDAGSVHTVRLLLEAGISPDAPLSSPSLGSGTGGGLTALMRVTGDWACALPAPEAFAAGSAGAAAPAAGGGGGGAASASSSSEEDATAHRPSRALLEALLHAGASVSAAAQPSGRTALHFLAASESASLRADPAGRLALACRLIAAGADPQAKDSGGATPGQLAIASRPKDGPRFSQGLAEAAAAQPKSK
jgi:hypothetical protein